MPRPKIDMNGQVFGKLTIVGDAPKTGQYRQVIALCDCGVTTVANASNIRKGTTTSCGCVHKASVTSHGLSQYKHYKTWFGMMQRCSNPSHLAYSRYGGRGITVCPEWQDVTAFSAWADTTKTSDDLTLDRSDNNQGYSPTNCRWVTRTTQQRNRNNTMGSSSQYMGVCYFKLTNKWKAYIKVNKKLIHLKYHMSEELAAKARDTYILENQLNDFILNFP